jgi:hypothetical protein
MGADNNVNVYLKKKLKKSSTVKVKMKWQNKVHPAVSMRIGRQVYLPIPAAVSGSLAFRGCVHVYGQLFIQH